MFSPEKDFHKILVEALGKEGKSISSLAKELEKYGYKHHRLILTGYLRALTDLNILKEREIPPAKIYIPLKALPDNIYEKIGKKCRENHDDPEEFTLYTLNRFLKRPVFESELRMAGISNDVGIPADEDSTKDAKKFLRKSGIQIQTGQKAYVSNMPDVESKYLSIIEEIVADTIDSKHLIMETRQTKLM